MSISRIYQAVPLRVGDTVMLNESASHHLGRVLRAEVGDELTLFNGEGGEYTAKITAIQKKHIAVMVTHFLEREVESPLRLTLAQGMARGEKMDFIIQKACELGVNTIQPLVTTRCNVRLEGEREEKRLLHWQAIIQGACEQSGRNRLPVIHAPITLTQWVKQCTASLKVVLSPWASTPFSSVMKESSTREVALLIGPEGGLSDDEIASAVANGFHAVTMGPRVLRTETATVVGLSVAQAYGGDFS